MHLQILLPWQYVYVPLELRITKLLNEFKKFMSMVAHRALFTDKPVHSGVFLPVIAVEIRVKKLSKAFFQLVTVQLMSNK